MSSHIREIIGDDLNLQKVTIKKGVTIVNTNKGSYVLKKQRSRNLNPTYQYLLSRSFDYFPSKVGDNRGYDVYEYIDDIEEPLEQKMLDLVNLVSLLHSKTTYYKEIDIDNYKEIYENINNQIDYLYNYYTDIITIIERNVYMSPSSYLIARNINMIFNSLDYCKENIDKWYKLIKDNRKIRLVMIHNNLSLDHYLKKDKPYLISWDKATRDMPIYDLLGLYQHHYLDYDFSDLFHFYESHYPLKEEERLLLFIHMAMPYRLDIEDNEYDMCLKARRLFDYLYKTEDLIMNYLGKES